MAGPVPLPTRASILPRIRLYHRAAGKGLRSGTGEENFLTLRSKKKAAVSYLMHPLKLLRTHFPRHTLIAQYEIRYGAILPGNCQFFYLTAPWQHL